MAETITPVVHGGRRRPFLAAGLLHVLGATVAAALLGLALGGIGALLQAPWEATVGVTAGVAALYFLREAFGLPVPLPDRKRQVPEWWRTFFSPGVAALLYGAGLGVGFLTYLSYGTFAAVMAGALASGDALAGALVCAPFGAARAVVVVVVAAARRPVEELDDLAGSAGFRWANAAALLAIATAAVL